MDSILKAQFNSEAEIYDETCQFLLLDYNKMLDRIIDNIGFERDKTFYVLDIGCGTGNLMMKLRKKYPNAIIYGIDFSQDMLNIAKSKHIDNVTYINCNLFNMENISLPFFDIVISSYVFHNFHTREEHQKGRRIVNSILSVNGKMILADLIAVNDIYEKKKYQNKLINLMREKNLTDEEIIKWLGILEIEDAPLTIEDNSNLFVATDYENVKSIFYKESNSAIFIATKKLDLMVLKSELLLYGLKSNEVAKRIYLFQNPQNVWKTGNNGIFLDVNNVEVLVGINHKKNANSPYMLKEIKEMIYLEKNGEIIDAKIAIKDIPAWAFTPIKKLNGASFSNYFVFEGNNFLHLAYKTCSFSASSKCKFCSTKRRSKNDTTAEEICLALDEVLPLIPDTINICLGGGTYLPFEENVSFFKKIIQFIRQRNFKIPIWVEMIPPSIDQIESLILAGASGFGFNIEIWNEKIRKIICPGKSKVDKNHYLGACKYVIKRLGPNTVGSCIIVGLDEFESVKEAVDSFVEIGVEPCILPYKPYDNTDLNNYIVTKEYLLDFFKLSKYASMKSAQKGIIFDKNYGCLKCTCCTIMHDFQKNII